MFPSAALEDEAIPYLMADDHGTIYPLPSLKRQRKLARPNVVVKKTDTPESKDPMPQLLIVVAEALARSMRGLWKLAMIVVQAWCITLAMSDVMQNLCRLVPERSSPRPGFRVCRPIVATPQHISTVVTSLQEQILRYGKELSLTMAMVGNLNDMLGVNLAVERNLALHGAKAHIIFELTTAASPTWFPCTKWLFCSPTYDDRSALDLFRDPPAVGYCWRFPGSQAHVGIRLHEPAHITAISLASPLYEQLSLAMLLDAPKVFQVWVRPVTPQSIPCHVEQGERPIKDFSTSLSLPRPLQRRQCVYLLGRFEYDITGPRARQYFSVDSPATRDGPNLFDTVVVEVLSNWGGNETCVYHVGVHGTDGQDQDRNADGHLEDSTANT